MQREWLSCYVVALLLDFHNTLCNVRLKDQCDCQQVHVPQWASVEKILQRGLRQACYLSCLLIILSYMN